MEFLKDDFWITGYITAISNKVSWTKPDSVIGSNSLTASYNLHLRGKLSDVQEPKRSTWGGSSPGGMLSIEKDNSL